MRARFQVKFHRQMTYVVCTLSVHHLQTHVICTSSACHPHIRNHIRNHSDIKNYYLWDRKHNWDPRGPWGQPGMMCRQYILSRTTSGTTLTSIISIFETENTIGVHKDCWKSCVYLQMMCGWCAYLDMMCG